MLLVYYKQHILDDDYDDDELIKAIIIILIKNFHEKFGFLSTLYEFEIVFVIVVVTCAILQVLKWFL